MNLTVRTKNFLEFNFISTVFFCLFFIQFFINSAQLNIGIWQDESPYSFTTNNIALARITSTNTLERISNNLKNSFQEVAINTVASSASQSAINGDSFTDSLKAQGENVLIYTLAKVGANEIGRAYHGTTVIDGNGNVIDKTPPTIGKSEQLILHAGLGAITSSLTGNDAMSGAIAGVAGELTAELANENGADVATSIQLANLGGAISSVTYGGLTNQSDEQMANNAWEGSRIGGNAGANNATFFMNKKILNYPYDKDYDLNFGVQGTLGRVTGSYGTNGSGITAEINPSYGIAGYVSYIPRGESEFSTISYGIRSGPSLGIIVTDNQNYGYTGSLGPAFQLYPIPYNISITIPTNNLSK